MMFKVLECKSVYIRNMKHWGLKGYWFYKHKPHTCIRIALIEYDIVLFEKILPECRYRPIHVTHCGLVRVYGSVLHLGQRWFG